MAQTWASHGPSNWLFLNLNYMVQGCYMPNLRVLVSILTDISNFLTQALKDSVTGPRCRAVHLARGQGHILKNFQNVKTVGQNFL